MRTSEILGLLPEPLIKIVSNRMQDGVTSKVGSHEHRILREKLAGVVTSLEQCIQHLRCLGYMVAMPAASVAEVNDPSRLEIIACIGDNFPTINGIAPIRGHPLCVLVAACIRAGDVEMSMPIGVGRGKPQTPGNWEW